MPKIKLSRGRFDFDRWQSKAAKRREFEQLVARYGLEVARVIYASKQAEKTRLERLALSGTGFPEAFNRIYKIPGRP